MKEQIAKALKNLKEFWAKLASKTKKLIISAAVLIILASAALAVYLNTTAKQMVALYPKLSTVETAAVCGALTDMGVASRVNSNGIILVPAEQQGQLLVTLAGQGYPQTAPAYDLYLNNTGFTRTESEKKQIAVFQLQEWIHDTLVQIKGIKNATAIVALADNSNYVWDENKGESSASITITMEDDYDMSPEQASAIRNLVAFSTQPQMKLENVKIIDAGTGLEITDEDPVINGLDDRRLEYENKIKLNIETNIKRLLTPIYGDDGVHVVAWVTLDYDKMITQQHQLVPGDDGNGVKVHLDEQYGISGSAPMEGLVGEENNTDVPTYPNQTGEGGSQVTSYSRNIDWDVSWIDTQIEKGEAVLKDASVSVVINEPDFTAEKEDDIKDMVSKAVNIRKESISVKNYTISRPSDEEPAITQPIPNEGLSPTTLFAIVALGLLLLILVVVVVVVLLRNRAKKRKAEEEAASQTIKDTQMEEIEKLKQQLRESAQEKDKESAITNEIREFAKQNPEITAGLIRTMLKEEE